MTKRKKRILTAAGILILIIVIIAAVAVVAGEKKIKIAADNGKEYWLSHDYKSFGLLRPYSRITLYDEKFNELSGFHVDGKIQKIEIKYDCTIDDWDFYTMNVSTKWESQEFLWKERGNEYRGLSVGWDIRNYIRAAGWADDTDIEEIHEFKGYALKRINDGEYEWLYSYGDILISEGHTELIEIVKNVVEDRTYSPKYVNEDKFYRKCEEILNTYSSEGSESIDKM
ncbi:MAG: hypothetical protein LUG52_05025 [Clostridia bacterium]|nr:hypothetical protein [Clostridia bacterium]